MVKGELRIENVEAMWAFGSRLGDVLQAGDVLLLEGDLGAGKTTLMQGVARGLGISESVESPTFMLINEYFSGRVPFYHLDLYRLEDPREVEELYLEGFWEGSERDLGVMAIEWCDRLPYLPERCLRVSIAFAGEGRVVGWEFGGDWDEGAPVLGFLGVGGLDGN